MCGHVKQCVQKYFELSGNTLSSLKQVGTPCIDDHQIQPHELEARGELSSCAARVVLTALYSSRISRPDTYWAVNTLARDIDD